MRISSIIKDWILDYQVVVWEKINDHEYICWYESTRWIIKP